MKRTIAFLTIGLVLVFLVSPAMAYVIEVDSQNGPQDPLFVRGEVHELGELMFPPGQYIESLWFEDVNTTACPEPGDDPEIWNKLVGIRNWTEVTWRNVHYVADEDTGISNVDGYIWPLGYDPTLAFKIDSVGINTPLVFESIIADNLFQPGEEWHFILQDFVSGDALSPTPFDSLGIGWQSIGIGHSSGSIIANPVPAPGALLLLGSGLIGVLGLRKKFKK